MVELRSVISQTWRYQGATVSSVFTVLKKKGLWTNRRIDGRTDEQTDEQTDGPADRGTDGPSYRDASTHLKR